MKTTTLILLLFFATQTFGQSKSELNSRIVALETRLATIEGKFNRSEGENKILISKVDSLIFELDKLKQVSSRKENVDANGSIEQKASTDTDKISAGSQCKAKTKAGTQCSRTAQEGSDYCWQHRPTYEPSSDQKATETKTKSSTGDTYKGREILTGPRGGKYYINANGKKTYIKK